MYNKNLIIELLTANLGSNNTEIGKLYNLQMSLDDKNIENLRRAVGKIRKKMGLANQAKINKKSNSYKTQNFLQNSDEIIKKVNIEKGTIESTIDTNFDPKNDTELAELHKIDLAKYKITNYWSKLKSNGKFTSSVNCALRKLGDTMSLDEIKSALTSIINKDTVNPVSIPVLRNKNNKALIVWVSDEHVGASVKNELYDNTWDTAQYCLRKMRIIDIVKEQALIHGKFDKIIFCTLGDTLDGFNGETTRGGHKLPQSMTNKEAIQTYVMVNKFVFDTIVLLGLTDSYEIYNVENSNHGGLGWDAAANLGLEMYLSTKYDNFSINQFESIFGSFSYGVNDFILTHGKDEVHMKRNFPLFLNDKTENYIKEYMDEKNLIDSKRFKHLVKGDLHQFTTQQGRFFTYTNIPSLFGPSGWSMANFGKGKAGFCYSVVNKESSEFSFTPVWLT